MTDLLKFQFYLYDSIVDQGLVKTLILTVDVNTGETRIASSSDDGSSDYIDINPRDINILEENTNSYSKAYLLRQDYQTEIDKSNFKSPKLELRIKHLNDVISRFTEWFMENGYSIPDPREIVPDADEIEKAITTKTVAILAPNLMGNLCDWPKIRKIADKHNLIVIEDSADTLGATINEKSSGSYSDMSITSFYGSHIINCAGNGGALLLNDKKIAEKAKLLRSWGRSSSLFDEKSEAIENRFDVNLDGVDYDAKFVFEAVGYNVEGSEIGAAFGLQQLKKLQENIETRKNNFKRQCSFFDLYKQYFNNPIETDNINTAWLAFPILINENAPFSRKEFQIYLEKKNIQTRVVFTGNIIRQPMMKGTEYRVLDKGYPNADAVMERGVLLPLHHGLTDAMFERLHKTIAEFVESF